MGTYTVTDFYNKIGDLEVGKENLRQVLISKGVDVSTSVSIDDYPDYIDAIVCPPGPIPPDVSLNYLQQNTVQQHIDLGIYPNYYIGYDSSMYKDSDYIEIDYILDATNTWTGNFAPIFGCYTANTWTDPEWNITYGGVYHYGHRNDGSTAFFDCAIDGSVRAALVNNDTYSLVIRRDSHLYAILHTEYYDGTMQPCGTAHQLELCNANDTTIYRKRTVAHCYNTFRPDLVNPPGMQTAYLFGCHGFGDSPVGTRIYQFHRYSQYPMYGNDMHLYPVLHWVDNKYVPCMYDTVSHNYFYGSNPNVNFLYG